MIEFTGALERTTQRAWRLAALWAVGPLTVLAGAVWAVAQPYRLTVFEPAAYGFWDHLAQPPVLVGVVGACFHLAVARPLLRELRGAADASP